MNNILCSRHTLSVSFRLVWTELLHLRRGWMQIRPAGYLGALPSAELSQFFAPH